MEKKEKISFTPDHERLLKVLREVASRKNVINYTELIKQAKVKLDMNRPYDRGVLGHLLGEISMNEVAEGRPMLSSVALHAGDHKQGQGFFDLAEEIYKCHFKDADAQLSFGMEEMKRTHNFWSHKV